MVSHLIETIFHLRSEVVVHQIAEVLFQSVGDDLAHFLRVETTVFHSHVTTILNGGDNRGIGGRTTDTAFFQLFNQRGLAEASRRFGKVLGRRQLDQAQLVALFDQRQSPVLIALAQGRHHFGPAVKA
ncbi:hypothetical protein SB00610_02428 [Klebsiella quasipneumoniae subsp. similipneumoniae]|nr:hypothetical protein SB00610_02428 [Klebsiella quasipneumoniae subsp. similipneumoniae]